MDLNQLLSNEKRHSSLPLNQVPVQRRSPLNIASRTASQDFVQMPCMKSMSRTDCSDVLGGERAATLHILNDEKGSTESPAARLVGAESKMHITDRFLGDADRINHSFEFVRFQRESAVRTWFRPREGDVFLDNGRAQSYRSHRYRYPQGVI